MGWTRPLALSDEPLTSCTSSDHGCSTYSTPDTLFALLQILLRREDEPFALAPFEPFAELEHILQRRASLPPGLLLSVFCTVTDFIPSRRDRCSSFVAQAPFPSPSPFSLSLPPKLLVQVSATFPQSRLVQPAMARRDSTAEA